MEEKIKKAKELERMSLALAKEIIQDIITQLSKPIEMEGVKRIGSSPRCVSVLFSQVMANKFNLSAEYYISEAQLTRLIERIQKMDTVTEVSQFINETLSNGFISCKCGDSKYRLSINPAVRAELERISEALNQQ